MTNDDEHAAALREIESLWDAVAGSPEDARLRELVELAYAYEEKHWPMEAPTDEEARAFRREQGGE